MIAALVVQLAVPDRPIALPASFALVCPGSDDSRPQAVRRLVEGLAAVLPDRSLHVVADSGYAGGAARGSHLDHGGLNDPS